MHVLKDDIVPLFVYGGFAVVFITAVIFAFARLMKFHAIYAPTQYAMGFSLLLCGLDLIWAASTINAPIVPLLISAIGVSVLTAGLAFVKGDARWRQK